MYAGHFDFSHPLTLTVDNVLSDAECRALVARIEASGPEIATINTGRSGAQVRREIRNNGRVIADDPALAAALFDRVRARLPAEMSGKRLLGANERLRFYRYEPGQYFGLHRDSPFVRSPTEQSLLTFMVYLNEGFEGGETDFPEIKTTVCPRAGTALLFQHMLLHEGREVTKGVKYAIRSDVMYEGPAGGPR